MQAEIDPVLVHRLEQAEAPLRRLAELLGMFRGQLVEAGFTRRGAEQLVDTFALVVMEST
jgi:hypothetical protein